MHNQRERPHDYRRNANRPLRTIAHDFLAARFAGFGSHTSRHPLKTMLGSLIMVGLCFGIFNYATDTSFDELWVKRGDRTVSERSTYLSYFGGLPRREVAMMSTIDGSSFITEYNLNALKQELTTVLVEKDTTSTGTLLLAPFSIQSFVGSVGCACMFVYLWGLQRFRAR